MHVTRSKGIALILGVAVSIALVTSVVTATATKPTTASAAGSPNYTALLNSLYKGQLLPPPATGPKAAGKGKKIWYIDCGESFEGCSDIVKGMRDAVKHLGWSFNLYDAKEVPSAAAAGIRQAIAAKADAIVITAYSCAQLEAPLKAARAAGIPVIAAESPDCDVNGGKKLFRASLLQYKSKTYEDYLNYWDGFKADYIISKLKGQAKVIDVHEVSQVAQASAHNAFVKEYKTCKTCKTVADVPFTWATANQLQQKVSAALLAHPEANAINVPADTLVPGSVAPAIKQGHLQGKVLVMGGEGYLANLQLIRDNVQTAAMAYSSIWQGWSLADIVNRVLSQGAKAKIPNEGSGFQAIDKNHNLPPKGSGYTPPIDFKKAYLKVWGVK